MPLISTALMLIVGILSVILLRKSNSGAAWAKPLAAICAILTLVLAVGNMVKGSSSQTNEILAVHNQYQQALATQVSKDLLTRHPNARVVILTPPERKLSDDDYGYRNSTLVTDLAKSLTDEGAEVTLQAIEVPSEVKEMYANEVGEDPDQSMMMEMMAMEHSMWFDSQKLSDILKSLQESADLVICTMDLSMDQGEKSFPPAGEGPGLVLVNGWIEGVGEQLKTTTLDTVVLYQQNMEAWKPGTKVPSDPQEAFNKRYLLVTKDNVDSLAGKHPQI